MFVGVHSKKVLFVTIMRREETANSTLYPEIIVSSLDEPFQNNMYSNTESQRIKDNNLAVINSGYIEDGTGTRQNNNNHRGRAITVNDMIKVVGEYGLFQKIVTVMLSIMTIPPGFHITMVYFTADRPDWKCVANSTYCFLNGTYKSEDTRRCHLPREDWTYVVPKDYSVQTEYDLICAKDWLISFSTTTFFIAWVMGAIFMGWAADNFGRKRTIFISQTVVLVTTCLSAFMPCFYFHIICRGVVGFFCPGTFPQMFILISELVGEKHRAFAGITTFLSVSVGATILCMKAYYVRQWAYLTIICSAPYLMTLPFYFFIPESICFLRIKGRIDEGMRVLERIASWNKTSIPSTLILSPPPNHMIKHRSSPIDLLRSKTLAAKTIIQVYVWFACGIAYVGLFLAGEGLGGNHYRDYMMMAVGEVIGVVIIIDLTERIGRKISVIGSMFIGAVVCVALGFTPMIKEYVIMRLILGVLGKGMLGGGFDALHTWSVELYPANIRGEGMGVLQVATRVGTGCSPWIANELKKVHMAAPFVAIGAFSLVAFILMFYLPETKGKQMTDVEGERESL